MNLIINSIFRLSIIYSIKFIHYGFKSLTHGEIYYKMICNISLKLSFFKTLVILSCFQLCVFFSAMINKYNMFCVIYKKEELLLMTNKKIIWYNLRPYLNSVFTWFCLPDKS